MNYGPFWIGATLLAGLVSFLPGTVETRVVDQPAGGKWDMKPQPVWQVEEAEGRFLTKGKVAVDDKGMVYFMDREAGRICSWTPEGAFRKAWGRKGEGPGEFKMMVNIHAEADKIWIVEVGKVSVFDSQGRFEKALTFEEKRSPSQIAGREGYYFVGPDKQEKRILGWAPWGEKTIVARCPFDQGGKDTRGVLLLGQEYPVAFGNGHLYAALPQTCTLVSWDEKGEKIWETTLKDRVRRKVSREDKIARLGKKRWEQLKKYQSNGRSMTDVVLESIPDEDPFYAHLCLLEDGRILALAPVQGQRWEGDLFSSSGEYQYHCRLDLPEGCVARSRPFIWKDRLIQFRENGDGDLLLVSQRIALPPKP